MAYTVTQTKTVFGDQRTHLCLVTADGATGSIATGLTTITGWALGPRSMSTAAIVLTATAGTISVSGAANGDYFFLTVFGR